MLFTSFSTPIQTRVLSLDTIRRTTGLDWSEIDLEAPHLPTEEGVYAWVDQSAPHGLRYHGRGIGKNGLRGRLSNQLRWAAAQRARLADGPGTEQQAYDLASELPAVQQAADGHAALYVAVTRPAPWTVERNTIAPPRGAIEWEAFISAVSLLVTGHRGLVGGGAWEDKAGSVGDQMTDLAWDRLLDVNDGTWS